MNLNTKSSRGITLIALVVTIIVLLILAGISISMLSGDNGLLQRATDAKDQIDRARKIEQEQIDNLGGSMNDFVDGYDENKNVNKPKLTTGMVPVNYNTSKKQWEECSLENWDWNYEEQSSTTENGGTSKWANAMTEDGSLWVWIPRYAYKIKSGYHTSIAGEIDIVFLVGATNKDKDGITYATSYDMTTATTNGYMSDFVVHPAFGSNLTQGGWGYDTPGFWVAKFEAGFAGTPGEPTTAQDSTVKYTSNLYYNFTKIYDNIYGPIIPDETLMKYPTFTPGAFSYVCVSVGDAFGLSKSLNANGNPYGFTQNCNTHQMKNSEWGAVAYLTHSKYGRNETEISVNNWGPAGSLSTTGQCYYTTDYNNTFFVARTGYSVGSVTPSAGRNNGDISTTNYYNTSEGVVASTTGNVYGVYDLSGGAYEYVASYCDTLNKGAIHSSGSAQPFYDEYGSYLLSETNKKYKELFSRNLEQTSQGSSWATHNNIFGDAMWEVSPIGNDDGKCWNGDQSYYPYSVSAFLERGGSFGDGALAGVFYFGCSRGYLNNNMGFRACVVSPD